MYVYIYMFIDTEEGDITLCPLNRYFIPHISSQRIQQIAVMLQWLDMNALSRHPPHGGSPHDIWRTLSGWLRFLSIKVLVTYVYGVPNLVITVPADGLAP